MVDQRAARRLNREVIAREGLCLLADHGLDGVTMRALATSLGVKAATLYWHVQNKRDLVDAMADAIASESNAEVGEHVPGHPVEEWLAELARTLRTTLLRYRDGARVLVGSFTPAAAPNMEQAMATLVSEGMKVEAAARTILVVMTYTTGSVIEEQARSTVDYVQNPYASAEVIDGQRFPLLWRARSEFLPPNEDTAFEAGLGIVLAGIAAVHL